MYRIKILFFVFILIAFSACDENYTPRPKGYFRIDLPEKKYVEYNSGACGYSFQIPLYAKVENYRDSLREPCWKYIQFGKLNCEIFLSYSRINNNIASYIEEARTMAYKHTVRAASIDETLIRTPSNVYAMVYDIGGNAASSIQFYATDSTDNFLRGALYFNVSPQPDSLAPVINFVREDVIKMIETLKFK